MYRILVYLGFVVVVVDDVLLARQTNYGMHPNSSPTGIDAPMH